MTAKHRKSKSNHKHEENLIKNEVVESEVRTGANSSSVHLVLFLVIVISGAVALCFCFQQHQTLTQLIDNVAGMQMEIMKLQSAHEEFRQSGTKVRSHPTSTLCVLGCCKKMKNKKKNLIERKFALHNSDRLPDQSGERRASGLYQISKCQKPL